MDKHKFNEIIEIWLENKKEEYGVWKIILGVIWVVF